jgi:hypothetical protein
MRDGNWQGHAPSAPEFRSLFDRQEVLASAWYAARLEAQQRRDVAHWERCTDYLERFLARPNYADVAAQFGVRERLARVRAAAEAARSRSHLAELVGTLGVDPALENVAAT